MILRVATQEDIPEMIETVTEAFPAADVEEAEHEILEAMAIRSCRGHFVVGTLRGRVVALAGMIQSWLDPQIYEVFWVGVRPEYQRTGLGQKLMRCLVESAVEMKGEDRPQVLVLSTESPEFFAKCGFKTMAMFTHVSGNFMAMQLD